MNKSFTIDTGVINVIAGVCYGAFRNWCIAYEGRRLPDWTDADFPLRHSYIDGVSFIYTNYKEGIIVTPEMLHEKWFKLKTHQGWQYGDVKDLINRKHPLLKPWGVLNTRQRLVSELFVSIVFTFLRADESNG